MGYTINVSNYMYRNKKNIFFEMLAKPISKKYKLYAEYQRISRCFFLLSVYENNGSPCVLFWLYKVGPCGPLFIVINGVTTPLNGQK